jgi:TonB-linked SusC/RagA family outer membrane protein
MKQQKVLLLTLVLLLCTSMAWTQQVITGSVADSTGNQLTSVSVTVSGSSSGTVTNDRGKFSLTIPQGTTQLTFSLVGYQTQTVAIGAKTDMLVTLLATPNGLADVVVVGYGVQRKRDVTGTISSVKGDDFKNLPISNGAQALQGRAAGVNIIRSDGAPGSVPTIRIRGTGTINNADPLVVIDGVPAGSLNDVNPNDIASIEILKDASSSAIYGTRAANGVVLVTTKKGNYGEALKTNVNVYTGTSNALKYLDLLKAPDLVTLKKEAYTNDNLSVPSIWNDSYYNTQRTDWQRALLGTGHTTNADVALRGGSTNSNFSFSGNYYDEKGIISNSYFKRYSARMNSEHRLFKIIRIGENFLYSNTEGNAPDTRSTQAGTVWSALRFNPAIPIRNENGSWGTSKADNELGDINNPLTTVTDPVIKNTSNNILTNVFAEVELLKGLKARTNYGYSLSMFTGSAFQPSEPDQTRAITLASLNQNHSEASSFLEEYTLSYNNVFAKNHSVSFTGGYSAQTFKSNYFWASRSGYDDETSSLQNLNNGNSAYQFNGGSKGVKSGIASYFGRLNYSFKRKYLLTVTLRADGSSKFPKGKQWGYFPAFSAGWRISDEAFFKNNISFINDLKLTGGWGVLGNQNVGDLQYLAIIGVAQNYNFGNTPVNGVAVTSLSNPNITWERAEMSNISLEFGLLKNKITGTVTYFNKNTKDMLIPFALTETYGIANIPQQNIGTLNNHGIEIEALYNGKAGAFHYTIGANATFINNKVTYLFGNEKAYINSTLYGRQSLETSRTYEGQPIASFFGFKTNGLYQSQKDIDSDPNTAKDDRSNILPGDVRFVDQNGDGKIDENDRVYLGNPNPKVVYGINGSIGYKHFDLGFSFAGVSGVSLYNADRVAGLDATGVFNWYSDQLNRWHGEGTSNTVPRLSKLNNHNNYRSSDLWIENGSYLALKNASLGYTFNNLNAGSVKLPDVRVYVACFNAFYITKYKGFTPELGYTDAGNNRQRGVDLAQYPSARTFTFGASFNF